MILKNHSLLWGIFWTDVIARKQHVLFHMLLIPRWIRYIPDLSSNFALYEKADFIKIDTLDKWFYVLENTGNFTQPQDFGKLAIKWFKVWSAILFTWSESWVSTQVENEWDLSGTSRKLYLWAFSLVNNVCLVFFQLKTKTVEWNLHPSQWLIFLCSVCLTFLVEFQLSKHLILLAD